MNSGPAERLLHAILARRQVTQAEAVTAWTDYHAKLLRFLDTWEQIIPLRSMLALLQDNAREARRAWEDAHGRLRRLGVSSGAVSLSGPHNEPPTLDALEADRERIQEALERGPSFGPQFEQALRERAERRR